MIEKATRSGNQEVNTLGKLVSLRLAICASDDNTKGLVVVLEKILSNTKDLKSKLASRGDDDNTGTYIKLQSNEPV